MAVDRRPGGSLRLRQAIDAITYATAVAGAAFAIGVVVAGVYAIAVGGSVWTGVKYFLFVGGFVLLSYATLRLWPSRPADDEAVIRRPTGEEPARDEVDREESGPGLLTGFLPGSGVTGTDQNPGTSDRERGEPVGRVETRFQRAVQTLPPVRWYPLAPERRLSPRVKLLLGAILVWAVSYLMETALDVGG